MNNVNEIKKPLKSIIQVCLSNVLKLLSGILVGFFLPKIIGVTDYGFYKTFTLYTTYVGLFAIGITDGIYLLFGGKPYDELDKKFFRGITRIFFNVQIIFAIIIISISVFFESEYKFILLSLAFFMIGNNISGYYQIISQITGRFAELSIRVVIQSLLNSIAIIILYILYHKSIWTFSYHVYTIIYCTITLILSIWYVFTYRDITFGESTKFFSLKKDLFGIIKLGIPLLIANICSSLILSLDRQFVSIFYDTEQYAIYAFSYNLLSLITTATSAISVVIYPILKKKSLQDIRMVYGDLISLIMFLLFGTLVVYFPLCPFISWFLPKYNESLLIFRIILPGLVISSANSIVIHNYFKAESKENMYFIITILILVLSLIANIIAYVTTKQTYMISIASVVVIFIWYLLCDIYLGVRYKTNTVINLLYMIFMICSFYLVSSFDQWLVGLLVYIIVFMFGSFLFFYKKVNKIKHIFLKKE